MSIQFHETVRGKVFFEHQLPTLIEALIRIATCMEAEKLSEGQAASLSSETQTAEMPECQNRYMGIELDFARLMPMAEVLAYLRKYDPTDRIQADLRTQYKKDIGIDPIWKFPFSDGLHLGTAIMPVREGFLSIPFNDVDSEDYEIYLPDDAKLMTKDAFDDFRSDLMSYAASFYSAMTEAKQLICQLILPQALKNWLTHFAAGSPLHELNGADQLWYKPYGTFVSVSSGDLHRRGCKAVLRPNYMKRSTGYPQCDMTFVGERSLIILAEHDTRHVIGFFNITADHKVIIQQRLAFNPIVCTFTLPIEAVFTLCNNALQTLLFCEFIESCALPLDKT